MATRGYQEDQILLLKVHESEAYTLYRAVHSVCRCFSQATSVGLHYTGGTKAMAVHAYGALRGRAKPDSQLTFSYLDARTLQLVFDPPQPEMGMSTQTEDVSLIEQIGVKDLFALHGWELKNNARSDPFLTLIANALLPLYLMPDALLAWQAWKEAVLYTSCRRDKSERWKPQGQLRGIKLPWPDEPLLADLVQALQVELEQTGERLDLEAAAKRCEKREIEKVCQWLDGGYWLETTTLEALQAIAGSYHLRDLYMDLNPQLVGQTTDFQLDVIAIRGYQLLAVSCSVAEDKKLLKSKLFEAYIRARQLGGDEARLLLICGSDDPIGLEMEIHQLLSGEGQIKVLGKRHWLSLADELQIWITTC